MTNYLRRSARIVRGGLLAAWLLWHCSPVGAQNPFAVATSVSGAGDSTQVRVQFSMPPDHHIYAGKISMRWEGDALPLAITLPQPKWIQDKFSGERKEAFEGTFEGTFPLPRPWETNRNLLVRFQGCDENQCYLPETRTFSVSPAGVVRDPTEREDAAPQSAAASGTWKELAERFDVSGRISGYVNAAGFLSFLDRAVSGAGAAPDATGGLARWGWVAMVGLILLGGIGLNFTPCILPLIPVNLAIIGARGQNSTRRRGFTLGAAYGLGMTAAYGLLGAVVVLTGSKFGTLNSSPWFNLGIAVVFSVLALGMFDRFSIDFSRFWKRAPGQPGANRQGPFLLALTLGGIAALLAGACVAPVVISVMVLAADYYARGNSLGLLLPFCLGLGMALPWPALGAGLSLLPKPGVWMTRVKYGFGVVIAALALYYGYLSVSLFQNLSVLARESNTDPTLALEQALAQAQADGKPVLVDFWASWCKNCSAMEHSTFRDPGVTGRLNAIHFVKFQAEHPDAPATKALLDRFGVMGLPTCVVLKPKTAGKNATVTPST